MMFFLGIQPHTDLEARLLDEGYLTSGYNPLVLSPSSIRKMLYNPAPLNKLIGKACLAPGTASRGPAPAAAILALVRRPSRLLSGLGRKGQSLCRREPPPGVELNSGRDVLLTLEEILNTRKSPVKNRSLTPS